jgi:hypothetical protein
MIKEISRRTTLRKRAAVTLFSTAISILAIPADAQVYKWVDANGVTQYSDTKPDTSKTKAIAIKTETATVNNKSGVPGPTAQGQDWVDKDLGFRQRKVMKDQAEREANEKAAQEEKARRSACLDARDDIDILESGRPVYEMNERGERVFISDDERAKQLQAARKSAAQNCPR